MLKTILLLLLLAPLLHAQTAPRAIATWDAVADARVAGYALKRGTTASALAPLATTAQTVWQDDTIEPTTRYWFAVAAVDSAGQEGSYGAAVNNPFRFSDIQPASPANLACSQTRAGSKVTLKCSWGPVLKTRSLLALPPGAAVTYRVFLSNTGTLQTFPILSGASITISDVKRHQTFYLYLTAVWNGCESLGSPAVRVQTQ